MSTRLLDSFTDREHILTRFQDILCNAQQNQLQILAIKGNSGTGKTFLAEYLSKHICIPLGWRLGYLSFAQVAPDFRSILDSLEDGLKTCLSPDILKEYRTIRDAYKRSFDEYTAAITVNFSINASNASSIEGITQQAEVNVNLLQRELQLRSELSRALLELAEECKRPFCLFIDSYERFSEGDTSLVGWLWEDLLLRMARSIPQPFVIVTCGWKWPDNTAIHPFSQREVLDDFDSIRVWNYLCKQGILRPEMSKPAQKRLAAAFYDLSRGHPLVLSLAVAYFNELPAQERSASNLQSRRPLVDERSRVLFLEERLLKRLPEPYRTLLEYGSILRSFDQATLSYLIGVKQRGVPAMALLDDDHKEAWESEMGMQYEGTPDSSKLDDRSYEQFLQYPFINQENFSDRTLLNKPTFHEIVRRVRIKALRHHHSETWMLLHLAMVGYYKRRVNSEQKLHGAWWSIQNTAKNAFEADYTRWTTGIPEQEFSAWLEFFYHALQVKGYQEIGFLLWHEATNATIRRWRYDQTRALLGIVKQLIDEDEPFIKKDSINYGRYLVLSARFLRQGNRLKEAQKHLEQALHIFRQTEDTVSQAAILIDLGYICSMQRRFEEAINYYKQAQLLSNDEPEVTAKVLNNIGHLYLEQKQLGEATKCFQQALTIRRENKGSTEDIANILNSIGGIYLEQGKLDDALDHFQQALSSFEKLGNPDDIAMALSNIGCVFQHKQQIGDALKYYQRALVAREQIGDPTEIAMSLNLIAEVYCQQGKYEEAKSLYERVLMLRKQLPEAIDVTTAIDGISHIYEKKGQLDIAVHYRKQALEIYRTINMSDRIACSYHEIARLYRCLDQWELAREYYTESFNLYKHLGKGFETDCLHELGGLVLCYRELGKSEEEQDCIVQAKSIFEKLPEEQKRNFIKKQGDEAISK